MPTKAIGKDTKNLTVNVSSDFHAKVMKDAKDSGCASVGEYVRAVLADASAKGKRVSEITTTTKTTHWVVETEQEFLAAAEEKDEYNDMLPRPILTPKKIQGKYPNRKKA